MDYDKLMQDPFGQSTTLKLEQQIKDIYQVVENILTTHETARNNDNYLIKKIWEKNQNIPASTITRVRRKIQNTEGKLLPTNPQIAIKRRIKEQIYKKYFQNDYSMILYYENLRYGIK